MSLKFTTPESGLNTMTRCVQNMKSGGSGCKLTDVSVEYTENGEYEVEIPEGFDGFSSVDVSVNVQGGGSSVSIFDGSFDEEGLRSIGWDDDDIAYFKEANPHYAYQDADYMVTDVDREVYDLLINGGNWTQLSLNQTYELKFIPKVEGFRYGIVGELKAIYTNTNFHKVIGYPVYPVNTSLRNTFSGNGGSGVPKVDTKDVTIMSGVFESSRIKYAPTIDTSSVTDMSRMFQYCVYLLEIPYMDTHNVTNMKDMFFNCKLLRSIPPLNTEKVTKMDTMFSGCSNLAFVPALDTSKVSNLDGIFTSCTSLQSVDGIDFSGLTKELQRLFGFTATINASRFIVNGKINVSISDGYSLKTLKSIDYDSVKSILVAASKTDNTNAKTLAFNRTMADPDGELNALVEECATKGWTITGLTLN